MGLGPACVAAPGTLLTLAVRGVSGQALLLRSGGGVQPGRWWLTPCLAAGELRLGTPSC